MAKTIDFKKSISELNAKYPEFSKIMEEIGFKNIVDPKMMSTVGRFMTIEKGAAMRKIDKATIKAVFERHGFTIIE